MLVELKALIFELQAAVNGQIGCGSRLSLLSRGQESHDRVPVVPCRSILQQLTGQAPDSAQQDRPIKQLGVSSLVELLDGQVKHGVDVAPLELANHPVIEVEFRLRV